MSDNQIPSEFVLGDDEDTMGGRIAGGTGSGAKAPHKPFPLMKVIGALGGGMVLIVVGLVVYVSSANKARSDANQFTAVPQPAIAQQAAPAMQPSMQGAMQPNLQPPNAPQGAPGTIAAAAMGNPGMAPQMQQPAQQMEPAQVSGQMSAPGQYAQQPQQQVGQAPAPMQAPQVQPTAVSQEPQVQPAPQPYANAAAQTAPTQQQVAVAAANTPSQAAAQKADVQRGSAVAATPQEANARIAELERQLSNVQGELAKLQKQGPKPEQKPQPVKVARKAEAVEEDAEEEVVPERKVARATHSKSARDKRNQSAATQDTAKQETGYVVTGMIGGRGFITKTGGNDVNPDASYAAGETLPDGRKVTMVDQKQKRVWLSDGKYIAVGN
ncbi:hypothetical protein [Ralstonia sp. ASV6]|uniref:hypothetical protein n=1 Tax=Ralstonia sp. ASV6 TaxID=2795124 RepID=UPI0018EDDE99|nr:hypothetical protein [Ralstonia sp. ASV6]